MESAVSFAPLRPADFVNFAGRGSLFFRGAERPSLEETRNVIGLMVDSGQLGQLCKKLEKKVCKVF